MSEVIKLNLKSSSLRVRLKDHSINSAQAEQFEEEDLYQKHLQHQYEKGFSDGQRDVRIELEKEFTGRLVEKTEEFNRILLNLEENLKNYEQAFDTIIIEVAIFLAEKIVKHEVDMKPIITDTLKESIKKILGANEIIIKVNPKDHEIIVRDSSTSRLEESFGKIKFEQDDRIEPGGCFVETEIGNVDSRISTQLLEIKKHLEASFSNMNN